MSDKGGAPLGSANSANGKAFNRALRRMLARRTNENVDAGLDKIAGQLVDAAFAGEQWAIREVADRIDGKPAQIHAGDDDLPPITVKGIIDLVRPG